MDKTNLEHFFSNGSIQMYSFGLVAKIVFAENPHNTNLVVHTAKEKKKENSTFRNNACLQSYLKNV